MKQNLSSGLEALLGGRNQEREVSAPVNRQTGRPRKDDTDNFARRPKKKTSLQIEVGVYEKIKQIAWDNRLSDNVIVNQALRLFIEKYEDIHGPVNLQESNNPIDSLTL